MTRALGPKVGLGHDVALPFAVLGLIWLPIAAGGLLWIGGRTASWLAGQGWTGPPFGLEFGETLLAGPGLTGLWPNVAPANVLAVTATVGLLVVLPTGLLMWRMFRRQGTPGDPVPALGGERDLAALLPDGVSARAHQLRPALPTSTGRRTRPSPADIGVPIGRLRASRRAGPELRASWEDVLLAVMAPRAGKTTALAIPAVLDAPGAVVATSNKADLVEATAEARAADTRERVWLFDPQHITSRDQTWWWNPLRGVTTVEEAHRLAGHFVQEVRGERGERDFWTSAAHDLLTGLLLAAALSGRTLAEVYEWLNDPVITAPAQILRDHGQTAAASSLTGRQNGAPETREGVYETARTAAQCLRDDQIMAWVTPPSAYSGLDEFMAPGFPTSRQSLFLLSKDGAGAAAPLVAALADRVMRQAVRAAELAGGRLDPPLVVVLDEAANICRIADLPELYSHLGSRGVVPLTILQSYRQGTRVWGEHGMDTLWSASTVKIIGPGLDDARFVEDVSRLIGEHDVPVRTISRGDGRATESVALRRQRVLPPEQVRALPRGSALVLATGCRPAMVTLQPWYSGPRAEQLKRQLSEVGPRIGADTVRSGR
jgi:type IV secretory pathway TraG/TraD family ATPase VirD4